MSSNNAGDTRNRSKKADDIRIQNMNAAKGKTPLPHPQTSNLSESTPILENENFILEIRPLSAIFWGMKQDERMEEMRMMLEHGLHSKTFEMQ